MSNQNAVGGVRYNGDEMIHRDLKPNNIFLDVARDDFYPAYPQALIGDFGQAFMTNAADERNPDWWSGDCATRGYVAPELERYVDATTLQQTAATRLQERTNVWQAGAILRSLVLLERGLQAVQSLFLTGAADTTYLVHNQNLPRAATYSDDLLQLIDSMMQYDANQRPDFAAVGNVVANLTDPLNEAMRTGDVDTITPATLGANAVEVPRDNYSIGMAPP